MDLETLAVGLGCFPFDDERLTPGIRLSGILSLIEFGNLVGPLALSVLYLR